MSKPNFGIVGICAAVSTVVLTVTLCIICLRLVIGPGSISVAKNSPAKTVEQLERDPNIIGQAGSSGVDKKVRQNGKDGKTGEKQTTFLIAIDGSEFQRARMEETRRKQALLDEADRLTGNGGLPVKSRPQKIVSLQDLPPEEKNRIWWDIARVAEVRHATEEIKYTLTTVKARRLAKRYQTSVLEIFTLFRAGAEASWRTNEAPVEPEDEEK